MKFTNRKLVCGLMAGVAGLLFVGNVNAANETAPKCDLPACCSATNAAAKIDAKAKPDLLTTCPVSGEKLGGEMGDAYVFVYKGQQVKLCCKHCKKEFDKDPAKYMAKIRAADKKGQADAK